MAGALRCEGVGLNWSFARQILFYPNSGVVNPEGQGFVSLYLACEVS